MKTLLALIVLGVLLVACAGGNNTDTNADDSAQQNAAENSNVQTSDAEKEFESYFAKRNLQWKIAYDLKSNYGGEQMTSQMTQYMKGEGRVRTDMSYEGQESRVYMVDETFTMCTKSNGAWSCFKSAPQEGDESFDTQEWEEEYEANETKYSIVSDGTKEVAGVTAKCFKVTEDGTKALVRYCFSSDGAPLYVYSSDGEGTSEMIATSYSKTVSDSDFVPPAEAQDIGAMYGGAGGTVPADANTGDYCDYCNYLSGDEKADCLASC